MKILRNTLLIIIVVFVLYWLLSIIKCEIYTYKYGEIFKNIEVHDIDGIHFIEDGIKVIKCSDECAAVYCDSKYSGNLYNFKKENNMWVYDGWDTIWSRSGSADGFIWPYGR